LKTKQFFKANKIAFDYVDYAVQLAGGIEADHEKIAEESQLK
jgi:hypothetical protein